MTIAEDHVSLPGSPPAAGLNVLRDRDVAKLLSPPFWQGRGVDRGSMVRYSALVALATFQYVTVFIAAKIARKDWRPGNRDVATVMRYGEEQTIVLGAQTIRFVESYIAVRKRPKCCSCTENEDKNCLCGPLFTSKNGGNVTVQSVINGFALAAETIHATSPLEKMLLAFAERKIALHGEDDVARRFMGYRTKSGPLAIPLPATRHADLERLARRSSAWFAPFERDMANLVTMRRALNRKSAVPASRGAGRKPKRRPHLKAEDHPLVAEMMAIETPTDEVLLKFHRSWLRKNYLERIEALVKARVMGTDQAAALLLVTPRSYRNMREYHFRGGKARRQAEPPKARAPRKPVRVRANTQQAVTIARLKSMVRPEDKAARLRQRFTTIAEYFLQVDELVSKGIVSEKWAQRTLDVSKRQMQQLRTAAKIGFPIAKVIPEGRFAFITDQERHRVLREWDERENVAESIREFWLRMRALGIEVGEDTIRLTLRNARGEAVPDALAVLVESVAAFAWSDDSATAARQRDELVSDRFAELARLPRSSGMTSLRMQQLFRLERSRCDFFIGAIRAGLSIQQASRPKNRVAISPEQWKPAVDELRSVSSGEALRRIYFRSVLKGFPGSETQFRTAAMAWRATGALPA